MIDSRKLLDALRKLMTGLEQDLRERIDFQTGLESLLRGEWQRARDSGRVGSAYAQWQEEEVTQAAVHWILACVFLRFIEDNGLCERPWLSGATKPQRDLAQDRHEEFFRAHPMESDREYLLACFAEVARLPAMSGLFDPTHNPVWRLGPSGDGAMALLGFWRMVNPDTGEVLHDFTDADLDTRFLGDLYQDLSESVRKKYALLQTPIFVEEFILDRTLTPALAAFGYQTVRLIDPTCGSGHFLLGAFRRLFDRWATNEPGRNLPDLAQRALDGVYGVDLNPFAVAIAHFRLTMAALAVVGIRRLADAPDFRVNVAVGDSLLHGRRFAELDLGGEAEGLSTRGLGHAYATEDLEVVRRILGQRYHAVVGNPPYITVKDSVLGVLYRQFYVTCHMQYSLVAPFTERFFDLALPASSTQPAGYVGLIAANSFMKREFGKKLIESFLPRVDLSHVIDTSGAYIPGHGTPTVILFGRNRPPVEVTVRSVMGIKGEPETPVDPAKGLVWGAIVAQANKAGSESAYISVADVPRAVFTKHPWSIGGGGAASLYESISEQGQPLKDQVELIGFGAVTREDEAFVIPRGSSTRWGLDPSAVTRYGFGEAIRDWATNELPDVVFPYDASGTLPAGALGSYLKVLWRYRTQLWLRQGKGFKTKREAGGEFYEYSMFYPDRYFAPLKIGFAFVATHNHFLLDRGGNLFNRSAPIIKLPAGATEKDHLALLGLLNSSAACFWLKQVFHNKGSTVDTKGARQTTDAFENFYEFTGTGLQQFPLVEPPPTDLARQLDTLARELTDCLPAAVLASSSPPPAGEGSGVRGNQRATSAQAAAACLNPLSPTPPPRGEGLPDPEDTAP
ncbi:BREX-2 system adenine-specific DNA-methyltransferase PglX [Lamprocystis purpurea]|jgi:hypothetical protein|uniref:BREX-2 system adenine-specific DNA-methyltransferase PglX n=1 Tax=Lamprocystis purpurea TaxID=61598 RepID=UPI0003617E69|nr:BREX-2 system adenine-specific DNA-methyltransferase PglX [Lamprocystis purpurea]